MPPVHKIVASLVADALEQTPDGAPLQLDVSDAQVDGAVHDAEADQLVDATEKTALRTLGNLSRMSDGARLRLAATTSRPLVGVGESSPNTDAVRFMRKPNAELAKRIVMHAIESGRRGAIERALARYPTVANDPDVSLALLEHIPALVTRRGGAGLEALSPSLRAHLQSGTLASRLTLETLDLSSGWADPRIGQLQGKPELARDPDFLRQMLRDEPRWAGRPAFCEAFDDYVQPARLAVEQDTVALAALARFFARPSLVAFDIAKVLRSGAFAALSPPERRRFVLLVTGNNTEVSEPARGRLSQLAAPITVRALRSWIADGRSYFAPVRPRSTAAPFEVARVSPGIAGGSRYVVTIEGHPITVTMPSEVPSGYQVPTIEVTARALTLIPRRAREFITIVHVGVGELGLEMLASPIGRSLLVPARHSLKTPIAMAEDFLHESGHLASYASLGLGHFASYVFEHLGVAGRTEPAGPGWRAWTDAAEKDGIHPSVYGTKSWGDDFAELWVLYHSARTTADFDELRAIFPNRFRMLDEIMEGRRPTFGPLVGIP